MIWETIEAPPDVAPPRPMTVRVQSIPARRYFPKHAHGWHQVVYVGMSGRTLARRFEAELGMTLRSWRRRLRLFRAVELLGGGLGVTQSAMELGYSSTSAFIYAFRTEIGCSPQAYMRGRTTDRGDRASTLLELASR